MTMVEALASGAAKSIATYVLNKIRAIPRRSSDPTDRLLDAIAAHLTEVDNWSCRDQFFGMARPHSIDEDTVPLDVATEPRRFRNPAGAVRTISEKQLLLGGGHVLLLGPPGAGKTTTLKRIARRLLKLTPETDQDRYQYPILIRLRHLLRSESITGQIAALLGLIEPEAPSGEGTPTAPHSPETRDVIKGVPKILDETFAVLVLDGLDELHPEHRRGIIDEISSLAGKVTKAKILLTCRSGDYSTQLENFDVMELCPLTDGQVSTIGERWLNEDSANFRTALSRLPFKDLADRPLLLTQLLFLYGRFGYLPEQPSIVYRKVVRLLLEDWDAERRIRRGSAYAGFDPERKIEFLSALAYQLTYTLKQKAFSDQQLERAYLDVHQAFTLPPEEAQNVAQELETHTGIIVAGPGDTYEFSHLSLQEYLCANFIVRAPFDWKLTEYMGSYSAPLAVAVALSSRPGAMLSALLTDERLRKFEVSGLSSLFSRIQVESPSFEVGLPLAFTLLRCFAWASREVGGGVVPGIEACCELDGIQKSLAAALRYYYIRRPKGGATGIVELARQSGVSDPPDTPAPPVAPMSLSLFKKILPQQKATLMYRGNEGRLYPLDSAALERFGR